MNKPKKAEYRQRAHVNPLNDSDSMKYPVSPWHVDWKQMYPENLEELKLNTPEYPIGFPETPVHAAEEAVTSWGVPDFLDVGCGFGGLSVALAREFPDKRTLGFEIRTKVTNYVGERIRSLRMEAAAVPEGKKEYQNVAVLRSNSMKHLVNFVPKGSCEKMFFCFPDPHFKKTTHRRRIVHDSLISTYAYVLKPGGLLYFVTDVIDLFEWMSGVLQRATGLFEAVEGVNEENELCVKLICNETEESKKVNRGGHPKYFAVFRRL